LNNQFIEHLKEEIKEKNIQISELMERTKEDNIIIQSLHTQLSIDSGKGAKMEDLNSWQRFLYSLGLIQ